MLTSDASLTGWGATLPPHQVSGTWSKEESLAHINSLELRAVFLALKSLEVHVRGQSILVHSDNTTVVSYINYQGGTHSPSLCFLTIELWEWCIRRGIHLSAAHIPEEDNLVADFLSRGKFLPSEWTLNPLIFQRICQVLFLSRRSTCLRPPSTFNFPSIVPVARILKLGRWTHSPSGGQVFHCMPSHPFRYFPQYWRRSLKKEQTWLWWPPFGLRDHGF